MSSHSFRRLLSRLSQDLAELRDDPYPGVAVFTDDADLRKLCLVLTPPNGPWQALALHFDVKLPKDWPSSPPQVGSSVAGIDHPNIFDSYICCDLLKSQEYLVRSYTGGYSPALTLRGLFLQFLTFFSSSQIEQEHGRISYVGDYTFAVYLRKGDIANYLSGLHADIWQSAALAKKWKSNPARKVVDFSSSDEHEKLVTDLKEAIGTSDQTLCKVLTVNRRWRKTFALIKEWKCASCPYGSEFLRHHQTPVRCDNKATIIDSCSPLLQPPNRCQLEMLNDDALTEIATQLSSESHFVLRCLPTLP